MCDRGVWAWAGGVEVMDADANATAEVVRWGM